MGIGPFQVLVQLRALHVLLRERGPAATATTAAAMLATAGANQAQCAACGQSCVTVRKVDFLLNKHDMYVLLTGRCVAQLPLP